MTLMEQAFEKLRSLSPQRQEELAPVVMMLAEDEGEPYQLTPDEEAAVQIGIEQADRGQFATDEQMRAIRAKHGL